MDLNKYLDIVNSIKILIEQLTIQDVEKNINDTKKRIDYLELKLQDRIKNQNENLPFNKIRIEFLQKLTMSVRSGTEKASIDLLGRHDFNVVGYSKNNYIILQKNDWSPTIGLIIYTKNLTTRISKKDESQLFYNEFKNVSSGIKTRSSEKKDIYYRIISLS